MPRENRPLALRQYIGGDPVGPVHGTSTALLTVSVVGTERIPLTEPLIVSGCGGCYVVAEVENIAVGVSFISNAATTVQLLVGRTSFTFGQDLTITPAPIPISIYDFSNILVVSGQTLSSPTIYYAFSAYSAIQIHYTLKSCSTSSGVRALTGPLAVAIPLTTDQGRFASVAERAFVHYFGAPCSTEVLVTLPDGELGAPDSSIPTTTSYTGVNLSTLALAPLARNTIALQTTASSTTILYSGTTSLLPSSTSSSSTLTVSHLATKVKVGVAASVPLTALAMLTILVLFLRRRNRKSQRQDKPLKRKRHRRRSGWQAYFQNKGELDAEEQGKHEAENTEIRREVDAEGQAIREAEGTQVQQELEVAERYELEAPERKHELEGVDHTQDLGPWEFQRREI